MSDDMASYNKSGFLTFVFAMVASFVFFIYITFLHPGVELDKVEEIREKAMKMAAEGRSDAAPTKVDVAGNPEPWVYSDAMVAHGQSVYATNCAFCHGAQGAGDGAAGATLNPKPRNLIEGDWQNDGSTVGLFKTLVNGIPGTSMAAFAHLPVVDRWAMVHFIHSITKNKVETDAAELAEFGKAQK